MNNSLPYKVVYSDGNERCTKCYCQIRLDCIQIAIMMQSDDDDCQYPEWYHQGCFFKTRLPPTEAAFDGFALLRYKDQLAIRDDLGTIEWEAETGSESSKLPDFGIEYAKTNRDLCVGCDQRIQKSEIRILKVVHSNSYTVFDGKATWYHVLCFARLRNDLNWLQSAESLPGFRRLFEEDKEMVKNYIPLIKRAAAPSESRSSSDLAQLQKQIRTQNNEYYEFYDQLKDMSEEDQIEILNVNLQFIPETKDQILHHLTDIIYFGSLGLCETCGIGQLTFNNSTYICTHVTGWDKCENEVKEPERLSVTIPQRLLMKYPDILTSHLELRTRILHCFRTIDDSGNDLVYGPYQDPPLFNMEFFIIGNLKRSRKEIESAIKKMGGKIAPRVHYKLAAIISNQEELQKMNNQMKEAKAYDIQIVSEDCLTEIANDPILYIITENLSKWGGDPIARMERNGGAKVRAPAYYTKSVPKVITLKWNDENGVDPECGLKERAHVIQKRVNRRDIKYSVILGHVDILNNRNSYYRMQLLVSNEMELFYVFESWGRISTVIGSKHLTSYGTLQEALKRFESVYEEKTGHQFGTLQFYKRPNKFYHLDIDFDVVKKGSISLIKSKLSEPVYQLMELIFDTKQMENMMVGCDLDLKQMPLGKISKKQIQLAMTTLKEISSLIQQNGSYGQLREASNRFYTLIPHAFGVERPPVIDSLEVVNVKNEMLESLLNMELIYGFLNEESGEKINPLDACYQKLKADICQVDKNSDEFQYLCDIVRNTHGRTHNTYAIEVLEVFKVKRHGEHERFQAYKHLQNRALLWHGSRLTNFVSILTHGLKVAPPEAAHTGYMFGKGIYFADVVSKSANYCHTDRVNNIGLLLMCEVALGNMRKLSVANHRIKDMPNKIWQSIGGTGLYQPMDWRLIHGVTTPYGDLQRRGISSLFYNEYVVYDPSQCEIKYLFKIKFNYKIF